MKSSSGRVRELREIQKFNQAAAIGRLMLGEFNSWEEFVRAAEPDYSTFRRRALRALREDVRSRLRGEIKKFCDQNFNNMTVSKLARIYNDVGRSLPHWGSLSIPLTTFSKEYAPAKERVLLGAPEYATVVVSLWGLQFMYPEDFISKDILVHQDELKITTEELRKHSKRNHQSVQNRQEKIQILIQRERAAARACVLSSFILLEAYLNGIAWVFCQDTKKLQSLSNRQQKFLTDQASISIRDKLLKYPKIISGNNLWEPNDEAFEGFIEFVKPFRDSLVHPSPFQAPERFGGYDKLTRFYAIDTIFATMVLGWVLLLIQEVNDHVFGQSKKLPDWYESLKEAHQSASPREVYA